MDESIVKNATQGVSLGIGVRVIAGERTGYAYSDDLSPEKILKAAGVAACIAAGPSHVEKVPLQEAPRRNLYPLITAPTHTAFSDRPQLPTHAHNYALPLPPRSLH